jgi:ribosome-binding factor A
MGDKVKGIKQAQRERLLLREVSDLFLQVSHDDPRLQGLIVSRIMLSPDRSTCSIFFYTEEGQKAFEDKIDILKLYRPSMRTALARRINARYTPELIFKFDTLFEKQQRIESIIESISEQEES